MPTSSSETTVRSLDGLHLTATYDHPDEQPEHAVLLVHGAGVTREEGGFFTRLASGLAQAGVPSLRFDLPGHGTSEGRQEDLTFSAVLNVITAGLDELSLLSGVKTPSLLAASFSGGCAAYYTAKRPDAVERLVLFNPLIDYKKRFVEEKRAWETGAISESGARQLLEQGYVGHGPSFKLGRGLLNEAFWFAPRNALPEIQTPTLIVHGTADTFVPFDSSRLADQQLTCEHRLVALDGAQHGFAVHDDPEYADPQSQEWQRSVIQTAADWLTAG